MDQNWKMELKRKRRRAAQTARREEITMTTTFRNDEQAVEAIERVGSDLDGLALDAKNTLEEYRRATNAALKDPYTPDAGKAHKVEGLRAKVQEDLREIEEKAEVAVGSARAAADHLARDKRSVAEQTRDDARVGAAFERARMLLDAGVQAHDVVSRAVDAGDKDTIRAMELSGRTYLDADMHRRGGSKGDYRHRFQALDEALKKASALTQHPAQTTATDLSETAEEVGVVAQVALREVRGGKPVAAIPTVEGSDFTGTVDLARENVQLLNQMGGETVRRAS